jgi:hypothetical protein
VTRVSNPWFDNWRPGTAWKAVSRQRVIVIELTLNTYSHVLPTMQAKAAQAMDGVFDKIAL